MIQPLSFLSHCLRLALAVSLALSFPAYSSEEGGSPSGTSGAGLSNATTKSLIKILKRGMADCQALHPVYRFDCYRVTYHLAANHLNGRPAYAGAQAALIEVETTLNTIVARNTDPQTPRKRKGFQTYAPIKPAAVPKATADFEQALDRAETMLLRSPERSQVQYTRIAEVVHSNKVLLRT